jgi:hypothetical protein
MINKTLICLIFCLALIIGCSKDKPVSQELAQSELRSDLSNGAAQISGVAFYAEPGECDAAGQGADYALKMTGDLEGCLYGFIDEFDCSPSGTYREAGREYFVGTYKGEAGTFRTTYKFEGRYEGCPENGAPLGLEIFGRCQHPITVGTGEGAFEGVTGRVAFKDDVEAAKYPYRGHFNF